ncbi:hypothetical protein DFO67_108156 [Modicisalibacter xianhensis]|uniref:Uncharacterized protein n=1 Tax=Modicisalibacter xianhensis TaxID=442341 RepID=A0A4R8FZL3_9GAMM|nr:hypothetical protein DFO67_108156 [Halomonas xianhensis]
MPSTYRPLAIKNQSTGAKPNLWGILEERGGERIVLEERYLTYQEAEARADELNEIARTCFGGPKVNGP